MEASVAASEPMASKSIFDVARELLIDWARERSQECLLAGDIEGWAHWHDRYLDLLTRAN